MPCEHECTKSGIPTTKSRVNWMPFRLYLQELLKPKYTSRYRNRRQRHPRRAIYRLQSSAPNQYTSRVRGVDLWAVVLQGMWSALSYIDPPAESGPTGVSNRLVFELSRAMLHTRIPCLRWSGKWPCRFWSAKPLSTHTDKKVECWPGHMRQR